jgi:hypothetical protein
MRKITKATLHIYLQIVEVVIEKNSLKIDHFKIGLIQISKFLEAVET